MSLGALVENVSSPQTQDLQIISDIYMLKLIGSMFRILGSKVITD